MIDLHTHVLPAIDDGPPDSVGSVALAAAAADAGTTVLVASPHVRGDFPAVVPAEIPARVDALRKILSGHRVPIDIVPGAELALEKAIAMADADLRALTVNGNGRDLMVETPYGALGPGYESGIAELIRRGFRIIAAHPERNPTLQKDPQRLAGLVERGVILQLTAGSLTRRWMAPARRLGLLALRQGWPAVIASDSHGAESRPPDLRPAMAVAARTTRSSGDALRADMTELARAILDGRDVPPSGRST